MKFKNGNTGVKTSATRGNTGVLYYVTITRSPFYSFILILPMFLVYEFSMILLNHSDVEGIRNGADVLLRQLFALFNVYGLYVSGALALIGFLFSAYLHHQKRRTVTIHWQFFAFMLFESIVYSTILVLILNRIGAMIMSNPSEMSITQMLALSLGAGVYEEFVFRAVLISGFFFFLRDIARWEVFTSYMIAMIAASVIFSAFHFIGPYGDPFLFRTFIIRFIAGILLSLIYVTRGFGIAAYSHSLYDLTIILAF